jgi:hypothetical protein
LVLVAVVVAGACGSGDEGAVEYDIGTRVTTSTTTPLPDGAESVDRSSLLRDIVENSANTTAPAAGVDDPAQPPQEQVPPTEAPATTAAPQPGYCFAMEEFVFESTQMMLQDDVGQARARAANALTALDTVVNTAPSSMSGPATTLRGLVQGAMNSPAASSSTEEFNASILGMVRANAALIDGLYATTIDVCQVDIPEPIMPSLEGAQRIAEA